MGQQHCADTVKKPVIEPLYIPRRWYNFLKDVAELEPGRLYTVRVIMPKQADGEPTWVICDDGKVRNQR